ncbi:aspartyl protease family protein [Tenacibaculum sp. M341]|uniref:aspartyl protease family protein n=1 Tax=Tenacibaculum sp. M341 TaxID=2530339 RepID=UPI001046DAF9|nr:aspartyl protease family protein [Tenacibaculum sp. M341]TCI93035.1 PDZ domain-containing protein [Tenacibaculum sp. M341]
MIKKILKFIGYTLVIGILALVVAFFYFYKQLGKLGEGTLSFNKETTKIPFYYASSGHMLIDVKVNDSQETKPFILDSGASNMIFKHHSEKLNLETNGKALGIGATGRVFLSSIKKIDSIKVEDVGFKDLNFKETSFNFSCLENVYGLIGHGTMKHLNWQIDFEKQLITVSKKLSDLPINENAIEIPMRINSSSHHAYVFLKFSEDTSTKRVIVDLGSSGTLSIKEKDIIKDSLSLRKKKIYGRMSEGIGGLSKKADTESYVLADAVLFNNSNFNIKKVPVKVSPTRLNLLGLGFFKKYKTTISWSDKKLILEPYDSIQNFIWKTNGLGMKFNREEQKLTVKSITENTTADNSKIPVNAEIISIDGKTITTEKEYCEYRSAKSVSDTLKIKIKDNNSVKEFQILKEEVFD